ncbi:MAG: Concanavalin A-like lectin/glucanase superfamily, partial [Bacteroidota bacterium]
IMDNRAKENWNNTNFFVINIWKDKPAVVSPAGTSLTQFGLDGTQTVPKNQWSHICWQYSQDGFNTFVNGVLGASTDLSADWNNTSGMLCFGATVDFQQGDFYHLEGSISQLLFRAGGSVDLYPTSGFTPPANLTSVASGKTDVVYLMKHGFQDLLKPDGCVVLETTT